MGNNQEKPMKPNMEDIKNYDYNRSSIDSNVPSTSRPSSSATETRENASIYPDLANPQKPSIEEIIKNLNIRSSVDNNVPSTSRPTFRQPPSAAEIISAQKPIPTAPIYPDLPKCETSIPVTSNVANFNPQRYQNLNPPHNPHFNPPPLHPPPLMPPTFIPPTFIPPTSIPPKTQQNIRKVNSAAENMKKTNTNVASDNKRGGNNRGRRGNKNDNININRGTNNRGRVSRPNNPSRGSNNRGARGNRSRGRNFGPALLATPGPSQEMDWFNMTQTTTNTNQGFTANDLPIRNNYGGRYTNNDDTKSETNRGRGGAANKRAPRPSYMGFKKLEEIFQMEPDQIVVRLCSEEVGFDKLLKNELSNDYIVLIIRVISKCCQTTFEQNKAKILARVCEKNFTDQLIKYLNELNLHDSCDKMRNKYFWQNNQILFWQDLIEFYKTLIQLIPNTAVEVLPKILKQTILTIKNFTNERIILIPDCINSSIEDIQVKLILCIEEREKKKTTKIDDIQNQDPPDDFRQISLYPMIQEITDRSEKVFLRPNIIDGSYQSVDHYLDVHFRLLREDFVAPLRDGICQHLSQQLTKERKRIFNIRFYDKVMFISKYAVQNQVAIVVQFNVGKKKMKLENTRRFMYGSLVCFTNNNFQSVTFGTVASKDKKLTENNRIAVDLRNDNVVYNTHYTMVECSVYFEPYYHVLKALQNMTPDNFPLKRYIIDVDPEIRPPQYLHEDSFFQFNDRTFYALQVDRWPPAQDLGLDASQYRAFQAALTREFCVIQGPPGTGKTYIGLKIAEILLENQYISSPILVICFTNHALDQFLEGICQFTQKVVRIGGQSKNEKLKSFNIKEMRIKQNRTKDGNRLLYLRRKEIRDLMSEMQQLQAIVEDIASCNRIFDIKRFQMIDQRMHNSWFVKAKSSELLDWLMGGRTPEERFEERRKQKQVVQQREVVAEYGSDSDDDEDDFFDPDEEQKRKLDDDDDNIFETSSLANIHSHSLLTQIELQERINVVERHLATIEVKVEETNDLVVFNERGMAEEALNKLYEDYDYFNRRMIQLKSGNTPARPLIIDYNNPHVLLPDERWGLYAYWLLLYRNSLTVKLNALHTQYRRVYEQYEEVNQIEDIVLMREMKVVGMTTTGAARYQTILQALKCSIVIVEEAAEVLESHVIVSLTNKCKHLIMIGDHKQLRPTTSEYRLRKTCNLDISLFERMVSNEIHCETLEVQHRMRPEIVKLIVPSIYPKLESHSSVYTYPPVMGVTKNLFFISHTVEEEAVDDSGSRTNIHEAKFLIKLARYFILQGYEAKDITILAAYSGQMFCLFKERRNIPLLTDVRITGVDNYQGEENKLILLSLVRSNQDANIGFLRTDNRVNVALSRAKEGMYIIGNMSILEKSDNAWPKIKQTLEENNQIGTHLMLQCQVHRDNLTPVCTADDFQKVVEGGCSQLCESPLNCGHMCRSLCHVTDREHTAYKCKEPCTKTSCEIGHPCPLKCYQECKPCIVPLPVTLKCGHTHNRPCHMNDTSDYQCPTLVDTKLECDHVVAKPCHRSAKSFPCPQPCDVRKECGHACERRCHIHDDPDHLKSKCYKPCTRPSKGCSLLINPHICRRVCFEECMTCEMNVQKTKEPCGHSWAIACSQSIDDIKCTRRCKNKLNCGHNCRLECWETCGKCDVKVDKIIESCGHKIKTKCSEIPDRRQCGGQCPRLLACGHPCNKKCNEPCRSRCTTLIEATTMGACGHRFQIPCNKANQDLNAISSALLKYCREPCKEILQCGHMCAGTCGECAQGRIHATCKEKCGATLICRHECGIPCRETCQPCNKKCYYRCPHNKCGKKCGEPCAECKEPCTRRCLHGQCTRLCSEPCNKPPCNEPCPRLLRCKHPCIGFCGEPCPPVCRVCNADDETFQIYFGDEDEPNARFVFVEECEHVIEAHAMDTWMQQNTEPDEVISVKCCPKCKTITMMQRYSQYIKQVFKDIIAIKKKVYLDDDENAAQRAQLQVEVAALRQDNLHLYKESKYLETLFNEILFDLKETHKGKRNPLNKLTLEACNIKFKLIRNLMNTTNFNPKCLNHLDLIVRHLILNESRISNQKLMDVDLEMRRFEKLIHLLTIEKNPNFTYASTKPEIKNLYSYIDNKLKSLTKYSLEVDADLKVKIEDIRLLVDKSISISEQEKEMIVKAVGLAKGRWFKCPQGHYYAIGDCGGAMEIAKCNECGAAIGGQNHALLETNRFAGEMDGAAHPAWSDAANLANYQLD